MLILRFLVANRKIQYYVQAQGTFWHTDVQFIRCKFKCATHILSAIHIKKERMTEKKQIN